MFQKNRMIHPEQKHSKLRRHEYGVIDPNAEISTALINQAVSQAEGGDPAQPTEGAEDRKYR